MDGMTTQAEAPGPARLARRLSEAADKVPSGTEQALAELRAEVDRFEQALGHHAERIKPITVEQPLNDKIGKDVNPPYSSGVARSIQEQVNRLNTLIDGLQHLSRSVDV